VFDGARVLVTGHTGFKGGWLALWLSHLGARVTGVSLPPETPSFFTAVDLPALCDHRIGDIRDPSVLPAIIAEVRPSFVFHLAAQPLVRASYDAPVSTIDTNVMGTMRLLDALRDSARPCVGVIVTSDKCYRNDESGRRHLESDPLGGDDVYSASKAAAELLTHAYCRSFFPADRIASHGVRLATARAGNVIGGGDWGVDRLIPDAVRAVTASQPLFIRHPMSVRPWQHVLDVVDGYLTLAGRLAAAEANGADLCGAWNFGPQHDETVTVRALASKFLAAWGAGEIRETAGDDRKPEATTLRLDSTKSARHLGWQPRVGADDMVAKTATWYRAFYDGASADAMRALSTAQIVAHAGSARAETEGARAPL
jgi:CDP-glucose 4,6-dehydratase